MKMAESSPKGKKTLWEKEKLLVTRNFPVFQCFQKTCSADTQKQGLVSERFMFNENGRQLSKRVDNTVGKGKIGHNEQISPFSSVFIRLPLQTHENKGLFGKDLHLMKMANTSPKG